MNETCPKCGSPEFCANQETPVRVFECGTSVETIHFIDPFIYESRECLRNQIAALKEENAGLKAELKDWRDYFKERLDAWRRHWREDSGHERHFTEALNRLKALGEL